MRLIILCLLAVIVASTPTASADDSPISSDARGQHIALEVESSNNPVFHGLEIQATGDTERRWVNLRGPAFVSIPMKESPEPAFLTWYTIRKPKSETPKRIKLRDAYSGDREFTVSTSAPAFFLMPAQRLGDGPPAEVPESLNHFIAFEIADPESLALPEPTPGRPRYICLPAEEWHHEEHFPVKDSTACLMVYEAPEADDSPRVSVIDQFGLNKLSTAKKRLIYANGCLSR
ncbi:MAG: hypothetical protein AAFU85_10485 [Planctomycetota bacterium]